MVFPPRIDIEAVRAQIGPYGDRFASVEERYETYRELIGFLPPRVEARIAVTGALDPQMLDMQERLREHAMYPKCFDVKTSQLMLFGMLLMDLSDTALLPAAAAWRAGATWEELQAVVNLCFLFRGLPAASRGAEILATIAKQEAEAEAAEAEG